MYQLKKVPFEKAYAEISMFDNGTEVKEYHAMIHVDDATLPYAEQLNAIFNAYNALLHEELKGARCVFKRYFLSDAANQADDIIINDVTDCAKSIIQQAPLDGTKVALWVYLMTNVQTGIGKSGLYEVRHGSFRHLWNGSAHNMAANSEYQTRLLFNEYSMQLIEEGCTMKDNCIRTWLLVNDVDLNYGGVVRARNQFFFTQGLTVNTHFIASTGIGSRKSRFITCMHQRTSTAPVTTVSASSVAHISTTKTADRYLSLVRQASTTKARSCIRKTYVSRHTVCGRMWRPCWLRQTVLMRMSAISSCTCVT